MSCGYIYKIQFPNGKHYIGLTTTSLEQRQKEHKRCAKQGDKKCLYNALRKFNMVDTFELIEIDTAYTSEELCEKEKIYITEYNSFKENKNGYNMTYGGEGVNGYIFTEDTKQLMSEKRKKYFENNPNAGKEHGEKIKKYFESNPNAGKEHGEKIKKHYENPDARQKNSERQIKRFKNPQERQNASERMKERFKNLQERQNASERMKKYYENPDAKQKNSESQKKYHQDNPDAGKEHSERMKKYYEDNPEERQKASESQKKYHQDNPDAGKEHSERMKNLSPERKNEIMKKCNDARGYNKPFDVFKKDGTFINTFNYIYEARKYLQEQHHITSFINIGGVLSGKTRSSAGFVFKYK